MIFDPDSVARGEEGPALDIAWMRCVRSARRIDTVLVNGEIAYAKGAYTDARSGVVYA